MIARALHSNELRGSNWAFRVRREIGSDFLNGEPFLSDVGVKKFKQMYIDSPLYI